MSTSAESLSQIGWVTPLWVTQAVTTSVFRSPAFPDTRALNEHVAVACGASEVPIRLGQVLSLTFGLLTSPRLPYSTLQSVGAAGQSSMMLEMVTVSIWAVFFMATV
jgi:hypothetical protein